MTTGFHISQCVSVQPQDISEGWRDSPVSAGPRPGLVSPCLPGQQGGGQNREGAESADNSLACKHDEVSQNSLNKVHLHVYTLLCATQ